jgi:hypothetical protein
LNLNGDNGKREVLSEKQNFVAAAAEGVCRCTFCRNKGSDEQKDRNES